MIPSIHEAIHMTKKMLLAVLGSLLIALPAFAQTPVFSTGDGAIRGYDPVAFFTQGKPVKGSSEQTYAWNGAKWYFSNAEHRDRFAADPEKYAPQYGGYCAYAVAKGYTASTVPEAWAIVDGKLYLNYSLGVQKRWRKDIPGYIKRADRNWPSVLG